MVTVRASSSRSRTVYVRMGGRRVSGMARYARYQSSPSGTSGSSVPAGGKNSLTH